MKMRKYATVAVVLLGVPWLLTGGCVGFECKYRIVEPYDNQNRPLILVNVANKYRTTGVPFLFTYTDSPPPYDAEFTYMTQNVVEGATLTIRKLLIRYGDGKEVDLTDQVEKSIAAEPYEMWYVEDHVQMRKPSLQCSSPSAIASSRRANSPYCWRVNFAKGGGYSNRSTRPCGASHSAKPTFTRHGTGGLYPRRRSAESSPISGERMCQS